MSYHYLDSSREGLDTALPDVEVFHSDDYRMGKLRGDEACEWYTEGGWYYAYGQSGCLWDNDPVGPYDSEELALAAARTNAGFCEHGVADDEPCGECPAPELWVLECKTPGYYYVTETDAGIRTTIHRENAAAWCSEDAARAAFPDAGNRIQRLPDDIARWWGRG